MSCSGHHFSVHSPDCRAHMNIQSNRLLQVEPAPAATSVGGSDNVVRWSSAERQATVTPHSESAFKIQPLEHTLRAATSSQHQVYTSEHGHRMLMDGDNYTLVILDCSPHPASEPDDSSVCHTGTGSRCCDCLSRCHCHTELIVRQQVEHDHACQHATGAMRPLQCGSGSVADRSASQTTTRSHETSISQTNNLAEHRQPLGQIHDNGQQVYRQQLAPVQQVAGSNQQHEWAGQQRQALHEQQQQTTYESFVSLGGQRSPVGNSNQYQVDQRAPGEQPNWSEQAVARRQPADPVGQQQWPQEQAIQRQETAQQQGPRRPREGTRIVKRWNWNQAQFVEEEVPDRPQPRPRPLSAEQRQQQPARSTDVWHQEIQAINSTLSPTPAKQYDPSWLAYRVPDEQSVQADPLYRDLMFELQRLEEGVSAPAPEPVVEHESSQKPVFGQPIQPASVELNEYESVEFIGRLIPISDPTMRVEWTVDGRPLLESSRITSEHEFGVVRLLIRRCEAEDSGLYQCRATNSLGEAVSSASLKVHAKGSVQCETLHPAGLDKIRQLENPKPAEAVEEPVVQQPPKFLTHITDYVEKDEGESVHFECCLGPVDDPDLKTEWFFNGRPLVTGSRFHTIDDFGFIVLDIDWLFPRDTGEYVCRATNKYGTDITRTVLRVRPDKNIVLDSQLEGADATIDKLRQLEFPDVVQEPVVEEPSKPAHFVQPLRSANNKRHYNEGDNVHFEARVGPATDGNLTVEWFHNGQPLISGHRFKPTFDFGHILLDILYVYPEDSGVYKCVARNQQGETVSQIEIRVAGKPSLVYQSQLPKEMVGGVQKITEMEAMWNRVPDPEEEEAPAERSAPQFVLKPKPYTAFEGSCARFCCRLVANPRPRVAWYINGQQVVSGLRHKLTYDGMYHLTIPKCQLSDAGRVQVVARNPLGECSSETELKVKRKLDDYRGVLKNSPNPWYDEATLKTYRRLRNQTDEDDDDYEEFLQNFQKQRQQQQLQVKIATEQQSTSPVANQVVGYMEPETPDVNLLASSVRSPLVEPGDLHPVVVEQQAIMMAPAPSTIQRALGAKDNIKNPENIFHQTESAATISLQQQHHQRHQDLNQAKLQEQQEQKEQQQQQQQQTSSSSSPQPRAHVFGLTSTRRDRQADSQQHRQQLESADQQVASRTPSRLAQPPMSPENVEHGREVHSHTHKQTQVERRANKEITREIIEKEIFEQEHKGFTRDSLVRDGSSERARSVTPSGLLDARSQLAQQHQWQQWQQWQHQHQQQHQQQQQQQHYQTQQVLIEDYMIPPEFVQKIQPCQAIDGDEARFECVFRGDPQPTITWYRESKPIKPSNLYSIETDLKENKSTLKIKRVTLNGNAVYTVKAENAAGSAKSSANLVVEPHPLPQASRGGHARQIDTSSHYGQTFADATQVSEAAPAAGQAAGESLKVVKSVRTRRLSPDELASLIRASPEGLIAPTFLHTIHDASARAGELARLDARLVGSQPMEVRWLKDGQRMRADQSHKMLLEGDLYTLLILECSRADEGDYECVATNRVGEARCGAHLRVSAGPSPSASHPGPVALSSGASSTYSSYYSGSAAASAATATSSASAQATTSAAGHQQQAAGQRTHFGLTRQPHNQMVSQYTSQQHATSGQLEIPKLIKGLEGQQVHEGKSVTLRCQISAHPKAEISWYKHGDKPIKPSKYFRIFKDNDETHCLRILETFPEDQGEYKCVARSQNGQVETSAMITVVPSSPK